ncbi:MAG TPA: hypothetical protein VF912_16580, partial [Anaeromyxobacter sp.]
RTPSGPPPPRDPAAGACVVSPAPAPAPHELQAVEPPFRHDQGVAEAAPPPYYRHDQGVAEAAPPPYQQPVRRSLVLEDARSGARVEIHFAARR